jgi:hypothetical protein
MRRIGAAAREKTCFMMGICSISVVLLDYKPKQSGARLSRFYYPPPKPIRFY